jgi:preprotein translocase subunit SecB
MAKKAAPKKAAPKKAAPAAEAPAQQAEGSEMAPAMNILAQTDFEVELKLDAKATDGEEVLFNVELVYAGIFRFTGMPQEMLQMAVLIEAPRMLFPFARQIMADATRNGSFPPLMIDPVDFAQLFQQRMQQAEGSA